MDKHVLAAFVVGDKAEALTLVEPFYCTFKHVKVPPIRVSRSGPTYQMHLQITIGS
jgi:hypothetical protein